MPITSLWSRSVAAVALTFGLASSAMVLPAHADEPLKEGETIIPVMFVQNAVSTSFSDGVLTLKQIQPDVLWFSNRPYRMAGTSPLQKYLNDWDESGDSFRNDPPNGTLSYLNGDSMASVAIKLSEPQFSGDQISYQVAVLTGEMPASTGPASLFIDFVGMVWHRPVVVDRPIVVRRPVVVTRPLVVKPAPVVVVKPAPTAVVVKPAPAAVVVKPAPVVVSDPDPMMVTVKKQPSTVVVAAPSETEQKLRQLKGMYDQGLISRREYKQKQEELLKQF